MMKKIELTKITAHFELEDADKDFSNLEISVTPTKLSRFTARDFPIPEVNNDIIVNPVVKSITEIIDKFTNK